VSSLLLEDYYEGSGNAPHEALGRAARRLTNGGALYLGGGVGIEKVRKGDADSYSVSSAGKRATSFAGPLSAVIDGFTKAGSATTPDSPGGAQSVADPAAAARLRELVDREAELTKDRARYERILRAAEDNPQPWRPGAVADDLSWEKRRLAEITADLADVAKERAALLSTGKVSEAAVAGKPGTNWKQVRGDARRRIDPIVRHYMGEPHPFAACVRDNRKRFPGPGQAERVCAVVKDMGEKTTRWRKGSKAQEAIVEELIDAALGRLAVVEEEFGLVAMIHLTEGVDYPLASVRVLAERVTADFGLLALAGHPLAEAVFGIEEAFASAGSGSTPNAARDAMRSMSPSQRATARAATAAAGSGRFDEAKHPRGGKGSGAGGRFVSKGSSGTDVQRVQARVGAKTDGKFGDKTKQAVMDFQKRHGLKVDGVVGHQTATAMAGHYDAAKRAKTGALRDSDRAKLAKLSTRPPKPRKGTAPARARGGVVV
jgi:hypothetical protein